MSAGDFNNFAFNGKGFPNRPADDDVLENNANESLSIQGPASPTGSTLSAPSAVALNRIYARNDEEEEQEAAPEHPQVAAAAATHEHAHDLTVDLHVMKVGITTGTPNLSTSTKNYINAIKKERNISTKDAVSLATWTFTGILNELNKTDADVAGSSTPPILGTPTQARARSPAFGTPPIPSTPTQARARSPAFGTPTDTLADAIANAPVAGLASPVCASPVGKSTSSMNVTKARVMAPDRATAERLIAATVQYRKIIAAKASGNFDWATVARNAGMPNASTVDVALLARYLITGDCNCINAKLFLAIDYIVANPTYVPPQLDAIYGQ